MGVIHLPRAFLAVHESPPPTPTYDDMEFPTTFCHYYVVYNMLLNMYISLYDTLYFLFRMLKIQPVSSPKKGHKM